MRIEKIPIELGECLFCHGKVTVKISGGANLWHRGWRARYSYATFPECENGCSVQHVASPGRVEVFERDDRAQGDCNYRGWEIVAIPKQKGHQDYKFCMEADEWFAKWCGEYFARRWAEKCQLVSNPEPCPGCSGKPCPGDDLKFGCPRCRIWVESEYSLEDIIKKWNKRANPYWESDQLAATLKSAPNNARAIV